MIRERVTEFLINKEMTRESKGLYQRSLFSFFCGVTAAAKGLMRSASRI